MDEVTIYAQTQPRVERGPQGQWVITFKGNYALHQRSVIVEQTAPPAQVAALPGGKKPLPRMRTLPQAVKEMREADPSTSVTLHALRRWVKSGEVQSKKTGKNFLVDLDEVERFMGR